MNKKVIMLRVSQALAELYNQKHSLVTAGKVSYAVEECLYQIGIAYTVSNMDGGYNSIKLVE